jgi:hypothetical protein
MRTFTLNGWASSVVTENDDGSADLRLVSAAGAVTDLHIDGSHDAEVTLDAPGADAPRPASLAIQAEAPAPKE